MIWVALILVSIGLIGFMIVLAVWAESAGGSAVPGVVAADGGDPPVGATCSVRILPRPYDWQLYDPDLSDLLLPLNAKSPGVWFKDAGQLRLNPGDSFSLTSTMTFGPSEKGGPSDPGHTTVLQGDGSYMGFSEGGSLPKPKLRLVDGPDHFRPRHDPLTGRFVPFDNSESGANPGGLL